eukprot:TRINITY_DN28442_c0_g1_i1.p2 TRINITY_DN28442_c0_g1~~TRINITY_DN28442_c0_g1_i1.p2  ORF type:complete len:289 (+),score=103.26 TRINITY_DN28442_c0_g1_i1:61-867(+)
MDGAPEDGPPAAAPWAAESCKVFEGVAGKAIVLSLTLLALCCYVASYAARRRAGRESRGRRTFALDLSKIGVGQGFAWLINLANTRRNSGELSSGLDPLSWYFPTFLGDELFAVPLGVGLGKLVCLAARTASERGYECWALRPLHRFGCYGTGPSPSMRWWAIQLAAWVLCVAVSRVVGGFAVPLFSAVLGSGSPFERLAKAIFRLSWSCPVKQWVFAGALRILVDLLQLAFVDFFNKYTGQARRGVLPETGTVQHVRLELGEFGEEV